METREVKSKLSDTASEEGGRRASRCEAEGAGKKAEGRRWLAKQKRDVVLRLLRGEDLERLSRETGVPAIRLSGWRDDFLAGGEAQLKACSSIARDREVRELQRKLGEVMMENELLREKAQRLEERSKASKTSARH